MSLEVNPHYDNFKIKKSEIENLNTMRDEILSQNHAMAAELESLIQKIKQKEVQFARLKNECVLLEERLEKLKPEYQSLCSKKDFMLGELKHLEPAVEDAKEQYGILRTQNNILKGEVSAFQGQVKLLKEKINESRMKQLANI